MRPEYPRSGFLFHISTCFDFSRERARSVNKVNPVGVLPIRESPNLYGLEGHLGSESNESGFRK